MYLVTRGRMFGLFCSSTCNQSTASDATKHPGYDRMKRRWRPTGMLARKVLMIEFHWNRNIQNFKWNIIVNIITVVCCNCANGNHHQIRRCNQNWRFYPSDQLGAITNIDHLVKFGDHHQICWYRVFIKLAFELGYRAGHLKENSFALHPHLSTGASHPSSWRRLLYRI